MRKYIDNLQSQHRCYFVVIHYSLDEFILSNFAIGILVPNVKCIFNLFFIFHCFIVSCIQKNIDIFGKLFHFFHVNCTIIIIIKTEIGDEESESVSDQNYFSLSFGSLWTHYVF